MFAGPKTALDRPLRANTSRNAPAKSLAGLAGGAAATLDGTDTSARGGCCSSAANAPSGCGSGVPARGGGAGAADVLACAGALACSFFCRASAAWLLDVRVRRHGVVQEPAADGDQRALALALTRLSVHYVPASRIRAVRLVHESNIQVQP